MKSSKSSKLLRRSLIANGIFSALSGFLIVISGSLLSILLGPDIPGNLSFLGWSLLLFAAALFRNGFRESIRQKEAFAAVLLDITWVIGSFTLVLSGVFSSSGNWIVIIAASVVLLFVILQYSGLRRLRHQPLYPGGANHESI